MPCIEQINLEHNPLESLPSEIGNLSTLKVLILFSTFLTSLPDELGIKNQLLSPIKNSAKLSNLTHIDIECSRIKSIQKCLLSLPCNLPYQLKKKKGGNLPGSQKTLFQNVL